MKLIIEIGEEDKTRVGNLHFVPEELKVKIAFAISNGIPLDEIRDEIERLHYHPKLDFIKNDEVVEMALEVIDKIHSGRTEEIGEESYERRQQ